MSNKKNYLKLLRPTHWVKNLIIALPLVLSLKIDFTTLPKFIIGFISFSFLASAGYILNDIRDIENDRAHPIKMNRPLANGSINLSNALLVALTLIIISISLSFYLGRIPFYICIFYFSLNYFYSITGKQIRFIDIIILSSFYIIRIFYGASLNDIPLTGWFLATLTLAVLSLSSHKRYMECKNSKHEEIPGRGYNKKHELFLQIIMINFALGSIILLNIHAYFVLNILSPIFYVLLNLFGASIIFFYFDDTNDKSEDPVNRIIKNKKLLITLVLFLMIYTYEILNKK